MKVFNMFITAVCVIFLIKSRWPKTKSLYKVCLCLCLCLDDGSLAQSVPRPSRLASDVDGFSPSHGPHNIQPVLIWFPVLTFIT